MGRGKNMGEGQTRSQKLLQRKARQKSGLKRGVGSKKQQDLKEKDKRADL